MTAVLSWRGGGEPEAPGAGTPPPELAGRDECVTVRVALERVRLGLPARSILLVGLRGVGKTVLLDRMRDDAERAGIQTMRIEAPEGRSLPAMLAPQLRQALLRLSGRAGEGAFAARSAGTGRIRQGAEGQVRRHRGRPRSRPGARPRRQRRPRARPAGTARGRRRRRQGGGTALALFVDELQYVEEEELAALITALHRTAQRQLPVVLVGAGLPQLRGQMGRAKSYAERLFDFPEIGALRRCRDRDRQTGGMTGSRSPTTRSTIVQETQGYPYFLQEWGKHAWDTAAASPITQRDVERASASTVAALDESFFRVRFDRLTPLEKKYLRAMAELGPGPHRSGDIAARARPQGHVARPDAHPAHRPRA